MAQSGYTPIQLYHSSSTGVEPTAGNLADGELAINITDGKLFYKDGSTVKTIATTAGASGDVVGPASATNNNLAAFDGTTGKLIKQANTVTTAQGGTGLTSFTSGGAVYATSTSALTTGTLPVASGGTGAATLTANNVLLGNGTSALQVVAPGNSGNVLTSNGTTWASTAPAAQSYPDAGVAVSTGSAWTTSLTAPSGALVGTSDTQTLTNKTIEAGTFTNGYTEETVTANTSTAYTIDLANGTLQILTLTGNCTYTFPTPTAGKSFTLFQKQDATGSRTVTWAATVKWPSSTAPTITSTASKGDKFVFTADGTYWWGSVAGQNYL